MLQCVAVRCSALQCVSAHMKCHGVFLMKFVDEDLPFSDVTACCSVSQCVAVCCSVLQCFAVCCISPEVP